MQLHAYVYDTAAASLDALKLDHLRNGRATENNSERFAQRYTRIDAPTR